MVKVSNEEQAVPINAHQKNVCRFELVSHKVKNIKIYHMLFFSSCFLIVLFFFLSRLADQKIKQGKRLQPLTPTESNGVSVEKKT